MFKLIYERCYRNILSGKGTQGYTVVSLLDTSDFCCASSRHKRFAFLYILYIYIQ